MSQEKQNEKTVPTGENEASIGLSGSAPVKEEGTTNKSPLAVNSAAEIPDWKRIGWKRVSESIEAGPQKNFDYEEILKELYYNDLWSYSGVVFFSLFSTWFIVLCGGGIGWIFVLCAFIATYLKSSMARFYRNAKSDIGREIAKGKLEVDDEKVEWLNEFLRRFWLIYEPVLSASIIQIADTVLGASTPSFLDSIKLTNFTLGTKPPSIETIRSYPKEDDDTVIMDWKISFVPNDLAEMTKAQLVKKVNPKVILTIRVGRGFVGAGMPILLEDVSFTGLLRVKLKLIPNYPHVETISLTFLEEPIIDYVLKPIGGETLGFDIKNIPGLQPFIKDQVHAVLRPMMYSPNVYTLVTEYLLYGYPIESAIGVLKLNIKSAKNLRNAETFGTSDPYCKVVLLTSDITVVGKELSRTKYIDNSLSPVWNETFYLLFNNLKDSLKFQIYDSNGKMSSDTLLGDNTFPLQKFVENPNQPNITIPVMHDKKQKGELYFDAVWYPVVETKRDEPVPESNIGILKFNLHQAKELDPRFSMVGVYNPYAELKYNGKDVFRSRTFRRSNNPIWEEFFEIYMTNRKDARLELSIRDERDFAEDPIVGSWSMSADELRVNGESKIDWFDLKNARSGKVRLSCQWKPIILDHIPDNSGYAEPLGVIKLHIKKATDLKNVAQLRGKSDPYIRIVLNSIYRGRTNMRNNNLNPIWDEYFYIPVHSLEEKLCLYCFDYENYGKDRNLGFTELIVNDLIKKSDDGKILSDGSIDITAPFKDGKGSLFYSASFHPILEIEKEENKENDIKVLEHQSGILVININHTKFKKKNTFIEFFVDNSSFPVYDTDMYEDEDTGIFIKDLNSSKIILDIKQKDSKSIGKVEFNVKESLKKCLKDDESIWLPVEGMNNFSLNIKLNYIPVKYNDKLDKNNKSDEYDKLGENEKLDENNKPDEDDYYKPDENINNVKHPHVEILNRKGHAAASAITDGVSKFGSRLGISKKKDKDENKKGDEKKEVTEKVLIPDKSNKNEVVPKPEEIKPINAKQEENKKEPILSNNAKQEENKEEYIPQNPPEKPEKPVNHVEENEEEKQKKLKQLKEANNEIKPYNVDLENDNPKQKEENNTLTRHIEFDSEIPIISRKQDEGSRSSEENGNKPNRLSSYSMNQSGEIVGEPGTLTITVIEAKNLIAVSGGGTTSNSYVKVKMNGKKEILKTSVVKKSTSPTWNEQTRFEITGSPISFLFCVRDRNLLSKDVDLGEYILNLWEHISIDEYIKDMWIPLSKGTNSQLHLKLDFVPSAQNSSSEKVNETNKANSRNGTMLRRTSISHGKSSGEVNDSSKFE